MEEGISVIVCCYNSASRLQPTLEHLYSQSSINTTQWEIIIVNNASTDDTAKKAEEIWSSFGLPKPPFRVVFEKNPGLSSARSTGIRESRFKYVAFCDDDNWLSPNYLYYSLRTMKSEPEIGALGGIGMPVFERSPPPHFWENQYHTLAVGKQCYKEGDITQERGVLYGAGMVLNKEAYNTLLKEFKFKFLVSDRIGNSLMSSGDHELCLALKRIGYKIYYSETLQFEHFIPENRTTLPYYKKLFLSFGKSEAMLHPYSISRENVDNIKNDYRYLCIRSGKNILKTYLRLFVLGYYSSSDKYKYINDLHYLYKNTGFLSSMLILKNSFKKTSKMALFNI